MNRRGKYRPPTRVQTRIQFVGKRGAEMRAAAAWFKRFSFDELLRHCAVTGGHILYCGGRPRNVVAATRGLDNDPLAGPGGAA